MKTFLTSAAAACLTLCIGVAAQGDAFATYTTLDVPGGSDTFAYGIDGSNIVGRYYDDGYHGFSYDGTTYATLDVTGANDTYVYGIDGSNIVGRYVDEEGVTHGFIATIPEPATLPLLALGMLLAWRRRLRRTLSQGYS